MVHQIMLQMEEFLRSLIENYRDFILAMISVSVGSLLTLFGTWFVERGARKSARADERRERIYAPLYDELTDVKKSLQEYGRTGSAIWGTYQRVKSEHIRYLIPRELRDRIIKLYEQNLEEFDRRLMKLHRKHETEIRDYLLERTPDRDTLTASTMQTLCTLAIYLPRKRITGDSGVFDDAFRAARKHGGLEHNSLSEFFEYWVNHIRTDKDFQDLNQYEEEVLRLLLEIRSEIGRELEAGQ
jgi:hypothetical protein